MISVPAANAFHAVHPRAEPASGVIAQVGSFFVALFEVFSKGRLVSGRSEPMR